MTESSQGMPKPLDRDPMKWTDAEVLVELRSETSALNKARQRFAWSTAKREQASVQRRSLGIIELRRMEFKATIEILEAYGVEINKAPDVATGRL